MTFNASPVGSLPAENGGLQRLARGQRRAATFFRATHDPRTQETP